MQTSGIAHVQTHPIFLCSVIYQYHLVLYLFPGANFRDSVVHRSPGGSFDVTMSETTERGVGRDGHPRRPSAFQGDLSIKAADAQPIYRDPPPSSIILSHKISHRSFAGKDCTFSLDFGVSPRSLCGLGCTRRHEIILSFASKMGQMRAFFSILFLV